MRRRSEIPPEAPPMTDSEAAVLLAGWGVEPPLGRRHGFGDMGLWLWQDDLGAVWREHEAFLRDKAREWSWTPFWWIAPANEYGLRFVMPEQGEDTEGPHWYAEALSLAGPQRI